MGLSTWPDLELAPLEERPLLQAARLRRFGVNYLQDGKRGSLFLRCMYAHVWTCGVTVHSSSWLIDQADTCRASSDCC